MTPFRNTSIALVTALTAACMGAVPALASVADGTSNTLQVAVAAAPIDQAHHRLSYTFENVMVESLSGTSSGLSLNFTKVELSSHAMSNAVLSTIAHGTQVGSEGIIAILIGLLH